MSTILIVDDEQIIRQLFQKVLEQDGHDVVTADNGQEALAAMQLHAPDLVLLDLNMPVMDGLSFLRLMRRNENWKDTPVVILSALADRQRVLGAGSLGVRDYLVKADFSLPQLRARIRKYLSRETPAPKENTACGANVAALVE